MPCRDVPCGGVLAALPALLEQGLVKHTGSHFTLPKGFYGVTSLFLLLGYLALARVKNLEGLRHVPPGEWGKLLGLDRAPEVRTLRTKLELLADQGKVSEWAAALAQDWMAGDPALAGYLYVDGHVRVYHGDQTALPKRYVARQRLCLPGTTDYWVNDALGRPFFAVPAPVDPGLIQMLQEKIVPRLEAEIPGQPGAEALAADPALFRFALVFDRAGYSPDLFQAMWQKRIACFTYRKGKMEPWPEEEFQPCRVAFPGGRTEDMVLAERGVRLGNGLWVRELRKQGKHGHQTALVTTDYRSEAPRIAAAMFSRWSQENFFKYMIEHFGINTLISNDLASLDETTRVVNPAYRTLAGQIKSAAGKLWRRKAEFGALALEGEIDPKKVDAYTQKKAAMQEEIEALEALVAGLKTQRKATKAHLPWKDLPEPAKFQILAPGKKQVLDTIKMIAYRAETALAEIIKPLMGKDQEARALLREVFHSEADLLPHPAEGTLTVALHHLSTSVSDNVIRSLCEALTATETLYPGTTLRVIFKVGSE
jgi:hypothetical protein